MNEKLSPITEVTRAWSENKPPRYTLKKNGRFYTAQGTARGFMAHGCGACYSFNLDDALQLQKTAGGDLVEIVSLGGFKFTDKAAFALYKVIARVPGMPEFVDWFEAQSPEGARELWQMDWNVYGSPLVKPELEITPADAKDRATFEQCRGPRARVAQFSGEFQVIWPDGNSSTFCGRGFEEDKRRAERFAMLKNARAARRLK